MKTTLTKKLKLVLLVGIVANISALTFEHQIIFGAPYLPNTTPHATYNLFFDSRQKERYKGVSGSSHATVHALQLLQTKALQLHIDEATCPLDLTYVWADMEPSDLTRQTLICTFRLR